MRSLLPKNTLSRRDFLRLGLLTGGALSLAPFLKACSAVATSTPLPLTATPPLVPTPDLLSALDGLTIDAFFDESFRLLLLRDPEGLTELGLGGIYGVGNGSLTDVSDLFIRQTQDLETGILERLRRYDRSGFTPSQALSADVYDWYLDDLVRAHAFMYDDYPINPILTSLHVRLYNLFTEYHPLATEQDARDYLARLSQLGTKIAQLIEGLELRRERGVILPVFIIGVILPDLSSIAQAPSPRETPFYVTLAEKLPAASAIPAETRQYLLDQAEEAIASIVIPAYQELVDYFEALRLEAPAAVGVWQFSDGEQYYAHSLRHHITSEWSVADIHALGNEHLERVHAEMRLLFSSLGYPVEESITSLYNRLVQDTGAYLGAQSVEAYEIAIREANASIEEVFDLFPRAEVIVVGGPAGDYYLSPAFDGSRPGIFYARTTQATPRFGVKTLAYHETIPGHHMQIAIAQELPGQPSFRLGVGFTGFAEGWALYAERLMWELGAYQDDVPGDLGRLQAEAFRAARLVVDTGIHALQWDFDRAVTFLTEATGFPVSYAQRELTRYAVWPGQATAYYLGMLKILELRQRAMDALGSRFDLKAFHRVVIGSGSLPLSILESLVDSYIAA